MDWMWTDTSFSIGSWFIMEDIFSKLFTLKCFRRAEKVRYTDDHPTLLLSSFHVEIENNVLKAVCILTS